MSRSSLARRLLATSLAGLVVLLVAGNAALSYAFRRSAESSFDGHLQSWQQAVVASLRVDESGRVVAEAPLPDPRFEQTFSGWYWQVSDGAGVVAASRSLWDAVLEPPQAEPHDARRAGAAIPLVGPRERPLRALVREVTLPRSEKPLQVIVAGDAAQLTREIDRFDTLLTAALAALGIGILVLVAVQMRLALRPLHALAGELAAVRQGHGDRVGADAPRELAPLVESLNALLAHDAQRVSEARAQAADLAHALKTPLSLVMAEASELGDERGSRIARHADAMRRHIDYRLTTSVPRPALAQERTALRPVVAAISETLARLHPHVSIEERIGADVLFPGAREDLEEIIGNLLENACKWAKGRARVTAEYESEALELEFEDDGPGLGSGELQTVLQRGVRLDETAPGAGLGLSIVADLVHRYGGEIRLDRSPLGGLHVGIQLDTRSRAC